MSEENVEIVRGHIEAFRRDDVSVSMSFLDPHVVRASGIELDQVFGYVWTVRAGKLARVEVYADEEKALEAVGLRE